eukprot:6194795-Pleurochrysis_carterae.AAC.2
MAATEASDCVQKDKNDKLELYTVQHYKQHFLNCVNAHAFMESVTKHKAPWTAECAVAACLQNGNFLSTGERLLRLTRGT